MPSIRVHRVHRVLALAAVLAVTACGSTTATGTTERGSTATGSTETGSTATIDPDPGSTNASTPGPAVGERIAYGADPRQFGELWMPVGVETPPVVVLIHGGFWSTPYDLTLMDPLAEDLVARGDVVWNVEYRRLGESGGGWPGTFDDVAGAIDHLDVVSRTHPIDLDRVVLVGHSAGGQLALWAAGRSTLPAEAPGAGPLVAPVLAIGQGPVVDLASAADRFLDGGTVIDLLGGTPRDVPERYTWATPSIVGDVPLVAVVGSDDNVVPGQFSVEPSSP
ncbi:MAG: alpha/beta hydrolase, partial [Ilumatobacteraceae bacterium]